MDKFKKWCASDSASARLGRTIFQGVIGVIIANLDYIIGGFALDPSAKTLVVALVMAVLAPIQAAFGKDVEVEGKHVKVD